MTAGKDSIKIDTLSQEQLDYLGKQLDRELGRLQHTAQILEGLAQEYQTSASAAEELKELEDGQQMMVPLTESLYVPGLVHQKDVVLVELGAGYYAERSPDEASAFCKRRITNVKGQLDEIGGQISEKSSAINQINNVMRVRSLQAQQASLAASKAAI